MWSTLRHSEYSSYSSKALNRLQLKLVLAVGAIPIDRSIVMDYVPSEDRGWWNAVESLTSMTWCASAFLGGYLADAYGYRFTFVISAVLYFASLLASARRDGRQTNEESQCAFDIRTLIAPGVFRRHCSGFKRSRCGAVLQRFRQILLAA